MAQPPSPPPLPDWRLLYCAEEDERRCSSLVSSEELPRLVRTVEPPIVLQALETGEPLGALLTALHLASGLVRRMPALSERVLALLVRRLDDDRSETFEWQPRAVFALRVREKAAGEILALLRERPGALGPSELAAFEALVRHGGTPADEARAFVFDGVGFRACTEQVFGSWLACMETTAADPTRPAETRLAAVYELKGCEPRLTDALRPAWRQSLDRVLDLLARVVADPDADLRLRALATEVLAEASPERLAALQAGGILQAGALPTTAALSTGLGIFDPRLTVEAAARTSATSVLAGLESERLDPLFAALALAPLVGTRDEQRAIGERVAALVGRRERLRLGTVSIILGELAAEQLRALVRRLDSQRAHLLERAVLAGITHPMGDEGALAPGLFDLRDELQGEVAERLRTRFADRRLDAERRVAIYLLIPHFQQELGIAPLLDESEDPELRALIGACADWLGPRAFADVADVDARPWRAKRVLPVSVPQDRVPLEWLRETLRLSHHRIPIRRAVQALVSRLLPKDATEEQLREGAAELRRLGVDPAGMGLVRKV